MAPTLGGLGLRRSWTWWALLGVLVLVAHASLFGVGPVGDDFRTLVEASRATHASLAWDPDGGAGSLYARAGTSGRPLAALSLDTSAWLWTSDGVWTAFAVTCMRLENLALLFLVAYGLGRFLRRLVGPWTGSEPAFREAPLLPNRRENTRETYTPKYEVGVGFDRSGKK